MTEHTRSRRSFLGSAAVVSGLAATSGCSPATPPISREPAAQHSGVPKHGMHLLTLGTKGGPTVRADRCNPANAVVVDGVAYVVDCGLGVTRNLVLAGVPLASLRAVFITHHHSDHNLEFGNLLNAAWHGNLEQRITYCAPPPMSSLLTTYLDMHRAEIDVRIADQGLPDIRGLCRATEFTGEGSVYRDEHIEVQVARNNHPPIADSYALRLTSRYGSIVFSGDTTPDPNVTALAHRADVLVHEVLHLPTLNKLLASQPTETTLKQHLLASHTTNEQVGHVATEAQVGNLVLSHLVYFGDVTDAEWERDSRGPWTGPLTIAHDRQLVSL